MTGTKHHTARIRRIHTRYCLLAVNALVLTGLLTYGLTMRTVQAAEDAGALHAMMDSDVAMPYTLLTPPEVK